MMKSRLVLANVLNIDVDLINDEHEASNKNSFNMGDSTYRHDGFSIGKDYLRLEGRTVSRGELLPSSLQIDDLIGQGAFSKVHRGAWTRKDEKSINVAVKAFSLSDSSDQRRDMLLKELRALIKVDCKCLVRFHGAFLQQDTVTMVLEYMDLGSIEQLLKRASVKFDEPFLASMTFQMLWGLAYLHHEKIIHRDIKPGNILLNSAGQVKWCDFGIVSLSESSLSTTVVGTTRYMAPERLRAKPYGRSSDIWSLGLVLLECLAGECPWKESTSIVTLVVTIEETAIDDLIPPSVSSHLRDFFKGCLNHQPEKRMPANLLMKSPWLERDHEIASVSDAVIKIKSNYPF